MSHRLDIRPHALADIADAVAWYEERQPGLGERFTREVAYFPKAGAWLHSRRGLYHDGIVGRAMSDWGFG